MARKLDRPQEVTFQTVRWLPLTLHQPAWSKLPTPSSSRPTYLLLSLPTDQFLQICLEPTLLLQSNSLPAGLTLTDLTPTDLRNRTDQGPELTGTDPPILQREVTSKATTEPTRKDSISSVNLIDMENDLSDQPPVDIFKLKKASCLIRTRMSLSQIPTNVSLKNRHPERL